jgi:hypothetical protein
MGARFFGDKGYVSVV